MLCRIAELKNCLFGVSYHRCIYSRPQTFCTRDVKQMFLGSRTSMLFLFPPANNVRTLNLTHRTGANKGNSSLSTLSILSSLTNFQGYGNQCHIPCSGFLTPFILLYNVYLTAISRRIWIGQFSVGFLPPLIPE